MRNERVCNFKCRLNPALHCETQFHSFDIWSTLKVDPSLLNLTQRLCSLFHQSAAFNLIHPLLASCIFVLNFSFSSLFVFLYFVFLYDVFLYFCCYTFPTFLLPIRCRRLNSTFTGILCQFATHASLDIEFILSPDNNYPESANKSTKGFVMFFCDCLAHCGFWHWFHIDIICEPNMGGDPTIRIALLP